MPNKLPQEDRDKLLVAGSAGLGFSAGWIPGFRSGINKYSDGSTKVRSRFDVREVVTKEMLRESRKAGLRRALPAALLFAGIAKAYTMARDCPGLESMKALSATSVSPKM